MWPIFKILWILFKKSLTTQLVGSTSPAHKSFQVVIVTPVISKWGQHDPFSEVSENSPKWKYWIALLQTCIATKDHEASQETLPKTQLGSVNQKSTDVNSTKSQVRESHKNITTKEINQNPTGDIWDWKSLNLNSLFSVSVIEDLEIGIWNAQSRVRNKESLIKNASLITTWIYFWFLNPGSTRNVLTCNQSYKFNSITFLDLTGSPQGQGCYASIKRILK